MDTKALYARGLKLRKKMFGSAAVEQRMEALGEFGAPLQQIINGYAYGDIWSRPGLDARTRSLVMVGIMAASNRPNELRVHLRGALANACTPTEIREVLLQVALYCGIPASLDAHQATVDILAVDRTSAGAMKGRSKEVRPRSPRRQAT